MSSAEPPSADLDDFFAKKDRKKTKKKFPSTPTELAAANNKKEVLISTLPSSGDHHQHRQQSSANATQDATKEDGGGNDEWLDYKEEQEKDYSGLKLRQLEEALPEPEEETDDNDQDDSTPSEPAWKVEALPVAQAPAANASVGAAAKEEANKSVYISPALRNAALLQPTKLGKASKAAPDLANDTYFPALGAEPQKPVLGKLIPAQRLGPQRSAWGAPAGSQAAGAQNQSGVALGNRYNTLDTDDS